MLSQEKTVELRDQVVDKGGVALVSFEKQLSGSIFAFFNAKIKATNEHQCHSFLCIFQCQNTN